MAETRDDTRLRSMLEVATAILLGLVSVATAAGAYQASEWARESGAYASAANQLRDTSLASNIASQLAGLDDAERFADVLAIQFDILNGAANVDELQARQEVILEGGSPGLAEEWATWAEAGFPQDAPPMVGEFAAVQLAPTFGANRASADAFELSERIGDRSLQITVASAIFALALLLLGVSGANRSLRVALGLAFGGAAAFVVGVAISVLAVVG